MSETISTHLPPALAPEQRENRTAPPEVAVEPYINKHEVARRLGKTLRTVDNWMKSGILPYYKIGRSVEFKWSQVEAHLAQTCRVVRRT